MQIEPFTLGGVHVRLEPLATEHAPELTGAARQDRSSYEWTEVPADGDEMARYIAGLLHQRADGVAVPFAQRRIADRALVGCTRFMELRSWFPGPSPDEVEIGGTWLSADAQRTPVNTEAKLLMFTHAFEHWGVARVALCTDARNERSRAAIERLGARFEGVLRRHRPSRAAGEQGTLRDTAMFAVTMEDWPAVGERLRTRLVARSV